MKISFIIPIYKVEKYIRQCVDSVLGQTYRDIEVVLVDDGSPDGCPHICDQYADNDNRIVVLHKPNGGLSDARNEGLKKATGEYVIFVDGDDFWLENTCLEQLVQVLKKHEGIDFIGFNCQYYYPESNSFHKWVPYADVISDKAIDKNTAMVELVKSGTFPMSACLKVMKREFLLKNQLFFIKGQLSEDIPWFINMLDCTKLCCFVNLYIYCYRQNVSSSITSTSGEKGFDNLFEIFKQELNNVESRQFNDEAKSALMSFLAYEYSILLSWPISDKKKRSELLEYKKVLGYTLNPKVRMVARVSNLAGIRITGVVLKLYQFLRRIKK